MSEYGPEVFAFGLSESRDDDSDYLMMDERDFWVAVHPGDRDRFPSIDLEMKDKWAWEQGSKPSAHTVWT